MELPGTGSRLVVALEGNPSTGYDWLVDRADEGIVRQIGAAEFVPDEPAQTTTSSSIAHLSTPNPAKIANPSNLRSLLLFSDLE